MLQVLEESVINSKPSVLGVISENIAGAYAAAARFNYNNGNDGVLLHVNLLLARASPHRVEKSLFCNMSRNEYTWIDRVFGRR